MTWKRVGIGAACVLIFALGPPGWAALILVAVLYYKTATTFHTNPANGHTERVKPVVAVPLTIVFGCFYYAARGQWSLFWLAFLACVVTFGAAWLVLPFVTVHLMRRFYRRLGWTETVQPPPAFPRMSRPRMPRMLTAAWWRQEVGA